MGNYAHRRLLQLLLQEQIAVGDHRHNSRRSAQRCRRENTHLSGVGREMGVLDVGGDRRREGTVFGRPIVTSGDFFVQLYESDVLFPNDFAEDLLNMFLLCIWVVISYPAPMCCFINVT